MNGIRVRKVPKTVQEKQLKIHFSKPSNGGGGIHQIYFPLFNNDAVIIFENPRAVEHVVTKRHHLHDQEVEVECLPEHMIFTSTEAKLDTNASVLLQAYRNIRDEMQFDKEIQVIEDSDGQTLTVQGNWFQLEWAWHFLDCFMQQQELIQRGIHQPNLEGVDIEEDVRVPMRRSLSPTDVNTALRLSIVERSAAERSARSSRSSEYNVDHQGVDKLRKVHEGGLSDRQRNGISTADKLDQRLQDKGSYPGNIGGPEGSMDLLKSNISSSYDKMTKTSYVWESDDDFPGESHSQQRHQRSLGRRAPSDGESSGDDLGLKGYAHKVPFESVHSTLGMENRERRADENSVFEDFSGLRSLQRNQELSKIIASDTSDLVADNVTKSEHEKSKTQSTSLSHKLKLYNDNRYRESANSDDAVATRLAKSFHDRSQISLSPTHDDMVSSQYAKVSLSPADTPTSSLVRSNNNRSLKSPLAQSLRSSVHDDTVPKYCPHETWSGEQAYSVPAGSSHLSPRAIVHIPDRYSEDQLSTQFDISGVKVVVYYGDLTKEETEAIVNAANEDLFHSGGVAGSLLKARGYQMQSECNDYISRNGRLKVTEVAHTSGGGEIKATHIMHTVGPIWLEFKREECTRQIAQTFLNCFKYANKILWIRSIALPAISTGVYGAPLDECVRAFLHAILMFVNSTQRDSLQLSEVRLVNNDAEATVTSIVLLQTLLDEGVENLTKQAMEVFQNGDEVEQELNLPKGRPERSGSFSKTYTETKEPAARSTSETQSIRDSKRRSSSLSRVPDKPKYEKEVYGSRQPASSRSGRSSPYDSKSGSLSERGRERTRTSFVSTSGDKDFRGASVIAAESYKMSSKTSTASARLGSSRNTPSIKKSLLSQDKLKSLHLKPGSASGTSSSLSKTATSRVRTSDEKVSARPKSSRQAFERSTTSEFSAGRHRHYEEEEEEIGLRSLPINLVSGGSSYREKFLQLNQPEGEFKRKADICAICLDVSKQPKQLSKCKHTFCTDCIRKHFRIKPTCPVCNMVYGEIQGDQPKSGTMTYSIKRNTFLSGYEREDGTIVITYSFPDGVQEAWHPGPGRSYKGFTRKAYLPNSVEGREVLRMLKKAFDLRLVFTIGQSRTTGAYGALTWNDLHHKTSIGGGPTKFGYPDPNYMKRIKEELAAKGITSDR